jgi:myo-inositol-1(or 4)-monophosphatase
MNDAEVARVTAEEGARIVRLRFGTHLEKLSKVGDDFATNADIEAEAAMIAVLRHERPHDAILGEESGRTGSSDAARTWLLDPLCGTINYAVRMRVVAVNVALSVNGRPTTAAVADPFNEELYWSDGESAWLRVDGNDQPLVPSSSSRLVDLNLDPPFANAPAFRAAELAADPEFSERFRPRVVSSSIALTWVASGQRAAYVTDGDVRGSVHFAAGLALVASAGGVVTDLRGEPWGSGATGILAAADAGVHAELVRLNAKRWR